MIGGKEEMCKLNKRNDSRRIDPCMKNLICVLKDKGFETLGCCCGHGKYNMTIVCKDQFGRIFDLISLKDIPRKKRFYKKDKQGYYYLTEEDLK